MNLHHLELFAAVARRRSVSGAAAELMISQPAISRQIKQLEQSLGATLFERTYRGVTLTEAGQLLATYAARVATAAREAEEAIADLRSLRRGRLAIAASPTIAAYLLPQVLVRFRLKYPGIRLSVEIEQAAAMYRRLIVDDDLDVALTEVEPQRAGYEFQTFMRDPLLAIVSPNHELTRRRSIDIRRFIDAGLILRETDSPSGSFVEQALHAVGIEVKALLRLNTTEALKEAVAAGLGVAFLPEMAVRSDLASRRLMSVRVKGVDLRRPLYRVTRRGARTSKPLIAFLYMLKHAARGSLPGLDRKISPAR